MGKRKKKKWIETTVEISYRAAVSGGLEKCRIPAVASADVPGLVYHLRLDRTDPPDRLPRGGDRIKITHAGSGCSVISAFITGPMAARQAILKLGEGLLGERIDWTQDAETLNRDDVIKVVRTVKKDLNAAGKLGF